MHPAFLALVQFTSFIKASACKHIMELHFLCWEKQNQSSIKSSKPNSASIIFAAEKKKKENITSFTRTRGKLSKESHAQNSILIQEKSRTILSGVPFIKFEFMGMTVMRACSSSVSIASDRVVESEPGSRFTFSLMSRKVEFYSLLIQILNL